MKVLVLDEGFMSGAYTALGLGEAGCQVDVLAAVGGRAKFRSATGVWRFGPRPGDPALHAAFDRSRYDVVYPVTEPLQALEGRAVRSKPIASAIARQSGVSAPDEHP